MRTQRARRFALCSLFAAGLIPSVGAAQSSAVSAQDAAVRRQLISDAQRASQAGNHEQAMNLAERASQIEMTPSLRLFLAQESNTLRRHVVALGHADLCLREIGARPTLNNRQRIIEGCTAAQTAANAAIGRVLVRMPNPTPAGATVTINATPLNPATWGVATPVDPGAIRVVARASGMEPFELELNVASGQEQPVNVVFRPAASTASTASTANTANTANTASTASTANTANTANTASTASTANTASTGNSGSTSSSSSARTTDGTLSVDTEPLTPDAPPPRSNVGPWVLVAAGGALAIGAGISVWGYAGNLARFKTTCGNFPLGLCNGYDMQLVTQYADDAGSFGVAAWVLGVASVGAIAGGVGWMLANNSANARARAMYVLPTTFAQGGGLITGGAF